MTIAFVKMHGCANDYLFVDLPAQSTEEERGHLSRVLSDRRRGVGADGVIFVAPSSRAVASMWMYNADGTRGAMCGNGLRCLAKYVRDRGRVATDVFDLETDVGLRRCELLEHSARRSVVRIDMGRADVDPARIPIAAVAGTPTPTIDVSWPGGILRGHAVSMGNPHVVFAVDQAVRDFDLEGFAFAVRETGAFPQDVNVEIARWLSAVPGDPETGRVEVRTHERGSGETHACGSGACAVAFVGHALGRTPPQVDVLLLGGTLRIEVGERIAMTGPAEHVFAGAWEPDR